MKYLDSQWISENFDEMYDDWEYDWSDTQLTYRDTNDDDGDGL